MNAAMLEQIESRARSPLCFWPADSIAAEWWAQRRKELWVSTTPDPLVLSVSAWTYEIAYLAETYVRAVA